MDCTVKKRPGRLNLSLAHISWQSNDGAVRESFKLADVKGMQATPPTAAKMRIKLTSNDGQTLMMEFSSASELDKARNALQAAIKSTRAPQEAVVPEKGQVEGQAEGESQTTQPTQPTTQPTAGSGAAQPAQPAQAPVSKKKRVSLDPAKLLVNLDLQRQVLKQDPELMKTFQQVVIVSNALSNKQFWELRLHLLVTAAQQQIQTRGSYNVLSTIKPTTGSDNRVNINLTREKIADVFDQYPLVRKAYNDNVPKLSEGEFWQRFFMSRLFLVLRGEKVSQNHSQDAVLDKYIDMLHRLQAKQREQQQHTNAPLFVNVEANDANNPETYGNNIVTTAGGGTKSLIRSVNGLSKRLLLGKRKHDETSEGVELVEDLRLRDLEAQKGEVNGVQLHIESLRSGELAPKLQRLDAETCVKLAKKFASSSPARIDLSVVGDDPSGLESALNWLTGLQPKRVSAEGGVSSDMLLVHATTMEFLRQFWYAVRTDKERAAEIKQFLKKSLERIAVFQSPTLRSLQESVERAIAINV